MWVYADTLKEVEDIESELSSIYRDEVFAEQLVDSLLDGCYPTYEIGGTKFYPSEVVRKLARPLYNQIMIEEIEAFIAEDLDWLKCVHPNNGDKLGNFIMPNIDYIIWKESNI